MSRSSHSRVVAVLYRDGVAWASRGSAFSRGRTAHGTQAVATDDENPGWRSGVAALGKILAGPCAGAGELRVLVSGDFARHLVVSWPDDLDDDEETSALAAHHFRRVFGPVADNWAVSVDCAAAGGTRLICAMDKSLLAALGELAGTAARRLRSVVPTLVGAYNHFRGAFGRQPALFIVAERARYFSATLEKGDWTQMRTGRLSGEGTSALADALERELALAAIPGVRAAVYAPGYTPEPAATGRADDRVRWLSSGSRETRSAGFDPGVEFAMLGLA